MPDEPSFLAAITEPLREFFSDVLSDPCRFRRGFVERIVVAGETLVERGAELFAAAPILEAGTRWVGQLKKLNLVANGIGEQGAVALLNSSFLEGIEELDLRDNHVARDDYRENERMSPQTIRAIQDRFGKRVLL
jgi:hypothetical protein